MPKRKWFLKATSKAKSEFKRLDPKIKKAVRSALRELLNQDCPTRGCKKLSGLHGIFTKKVHPYRIAFYLDTKDVKITEEYNGTVNVIAIVRLQEVLSELLRKDRGK